MAFTKITSAGIGTTETVTLDGLSVINNGSFGGNLTVGGVLTYEDVTNVDSVGLITARNGIVVGSGITLSKDGDIFATGITTVSGNVKVGTGITLSPDGDVFFTGIATGNGSGLTNLNASNLASGTVPTARLGSGTASSSTFLRGDSTFQTITTDLVGDTSPQLGGALDTNGNNITMGDGDELRIGDSSDLQLYHASNNSHIKNDTNSLIIRSDALRCNNNANSATMIKADAGGAVELYWNNARKLHTVQYGVDIDGNLYIGDSGEGKILIGAGEDLKIYHDGTTNYMESDNGGIAFRVASGNRIEINGTSGDVTMQGSGGKNFLWDNSTAYLNLNDNATLTCGTDDDLQLVHNNSSSYILHNGTGDMYIGTGGADEILYFQTSGNAKWRMNPDGALKAGTHIDGGNGSEGANYHMHITSNFSPQKACLLLEDYSYYSDGEALRVNNADDNSGRLMEDVQFTREDTLVGYIRIHSSSTTYSTSGSDRRLKKNFEDWTEDNLSKFKTLSPQLFNWNTEADGTAKTKGFIAQDNLEKFPEAYPLTTKTDRYYFNPSGMVHYLMKAMKEAAIKIETLEAEVAALKSS